ncbi:helix-turn-helix transcriptional regulator [Paenibacillus koleovorans]|uniref:helix-turn-helix transcriptional regulator n=1 Tax=Paenibacillus koleovorans TaxID=121608 RepID=UPI000FDA90F5|nr:helix-turn-helix domain-containing protein [Paenibacillus koleovorans]
MDILHHFEFPFPVNDFLIERVQRDRLTDNYPAHNHDETYEMYYLLDGSRRYWIKDQFYRLEKGQLILIDRTDVHQPLDDSYRDGIIIAFNRKFLDGHIESIPELLNIFTDIKLLRLSAAERSFIESLLTKMLREYNKREFGYMDYMRISLLELLLWMQRHVHHERSNREIHRNPLHRKVGDIAKFIAASYSDPLTLTMLADMFHISPFHLSRLFKLVTGFTFVKYLNNVRTSESQKLLRDSEFSITDISQIVGFDSPTHFGRVFKELTGCTPSQYRSQHRK